ncbi:hypothetical protein ABB37_05397 [Leptomonas pyrrhocoris]|uniref:Uncharacterized protein n=1 Tax=Leptomonas pyrrhocoris TaxID=157538 RepID=A0A0N0VEX9_LEPPY|nr:hypothetical protein ABB37_05397 [Leptomonas pyrrhocoris]XP_015658032.1 hypothetical protein ABB37_05397 [Leptomonas pyrrhocoris]XP_015658033.1 hypothetical protein ABB37_05397 [Leptomonas pyrrhocoris]KPA79592.1 hypothetical protein ABB37_05397 [Leptomonas pyrrhocoris]KPA79593.1 hypothetical protein ABB37_05397 [Leptomonas pyrrhocoris]KPA79594.1 hypothetical protein ABB37_05397 [Leptomonas pyrrhocoris]|eukprot:XP_015658031.1 hypothetical protein ABB37_05397 [Leptomonas pyrrhocoris]
MGPRKNNAAAAGKDDGSAMGKMRKINPAGASTSTTGNSTSNRHLNTKAAVDDIGYTNEERAFLESQLTLFQSSKNMNEANTSSNAARTDFAAMTKERWLTGLPLLLSATEKLLQAAAEQYQITCKNRAAAAAAAAATQRAAGGAGPTSLPPINTHEKEASFSDVGKPTPGIGSNNLSITDGALPAMNASSAAPRPTPAAGTAAQFTEENAYIRSQAQQLQWYPFTYQRWLELLLEPGKYHTAKDEGRLRGDAIQASLRRCILVTYPAVEGGDFI